MLKDGIEFYYQACQLKDLLRQGAVQWGVKKERLESIAEHTYGCMILAIALHSELKLDINLGKTLEMLAIHELEEIFIGDITPLSHIEKKNLDNKARKMVSSILQNLHQHDELLALTDEFNLNYSKEAKFARAVDKLECVLEFKKYQDNGQVSLENLTDDMLKNNHLKTLVESKKYDLADIFFIYHLPAYKDFGIDEKLWFNVLKQIKTLNYQEKEI